MAWRLALVSLLSKCEMALLKLNNVERRKYSGASPRIKFTSPTRFARKDCVNLIRGLACLSSGGELLE